MLLIGRCRSKMFTTLRSVSRMKRAIKNSDRTCDGRLSVAVENEVDYLSTFMWYGGMRGFEKFPSKISELLEILWESYF